jgi:hypothetical protein
MDLQLLDKKWLSLSPLERRDQLCIFEEKCKALENVAGESIEPVIYSCNGVYAREITIPEGVALVGKIHLTEQLNIVSKGKIRVATEEGVRTITAPCTFISPAGTKRAGYALEETVWTVLLATELTTEEDITKAFIAPNYNTLDKLGVK